MTEPSDRPEGAAAPSSSAPPSASSGSPTAGHPEAAPETVAAPPDDAPAPIEPGAVFDRYTVLEKLGAGAMGEVYAAYDAKLDRKVALKMLRHRNPEYEARLMREAQAMARLSHSNVVGVFDTGVVGERLYLAMEFVRGATLRKWQRAEKRSHTELLAAYAAAGRGLAAAHAAGLVHRDFKPDNVLVAEDGQVKVTDFGIARALEEHTLPAAQRLAGKLSASSASTSTDGSEPSVPSLSASMNPSVSGSVSTGRLLSTNMTEAGMLLGTPGYMAPEQFLGESVDLRTDQFAFAVSLFEALYGRKPFLPKDGKKKLTIERIAQATLLGKVAPPPKGSSVPAHVHRVLSRALSLDKDDRYPNLEALLDDLARDPERQRRRLLALGAAALALAMASVAGVRALSARQAKLCSATLTEASEAWNPDIAATAEKGLLATGVPYAADTWRRTRDNVDAYMRAWSEMHQQTCEATRIHGHQSESVMTLRMSCLEQRKNEVRALLQVLSNADAEVAAKALQASMHLTRVDVCKDVASLSAVVPEPTEPAARAELQSVREGLARIKANIDAGRYPVARDEATPLVARARALGYAPALAESLLLSAQAQARAGASRERAIVEGTEAVARADAGRSDTTRAEGAISLMLWLMEAGNYTEAERWATVADGALRRSEESGGLRAEWLRVSGRILEAQGKAEDALARGREAIALGKASKASPQVLLDLGRSLAEAEARHGHRAEAERLMSDAEELLLKTMGPDHPTAIRIAFAHGAVAGISGDMRASLQHNLRAIELAERVAPNDDFLPDAYSNACECKNLLGDATGAFPLCEKSLALGIKLFGPDGITVAYTHTVAGNVALALKRYKEALSQYETAILIHERTGTQGDTDYPWALIGFGHTKLLVGEPKVAIKSLDRALALEMGYKQRSPEDDRAIANARFYLAQARWATGERTVAVLEMARTAKEGYRALDKQAEAKDVDDWLAARAPK